VPLHLHHSSQLGINLFDCHPEGAAATEGPPANGSGTLQVARLFDLHTGEPDFRLKSRTTNN
jgi:hypothetical protein